MPLHVSSTCARNMAWNKLIVKQNFCASSWLITEIKICTLPTQFIQALRVLCYLTVFLTRIKSLVSVMETQRCPWGTNCRKRNFLNFFMWIFMRVVRTVVQGVSPWSLTAEVRFRYKVSPFNTGLFKMTVGVSTTCHTQYIWDKSICFFFYFIELHSKFLLHTLQVLYMRTFVILQTSTR